MFPEFALHGWLDAVKRETEFDLTQSGLTRYAYWDYEGIVPPRLRDLEDPPPEPPIEELLADEYGVATDAVRVTARCQHANFVATAAARDLAEERGIRRPRALVETPTYEPMAKTPVGLGLAVDRFPRRPEDGYRIDPDRVADAMTPDTCLIQLTNRHNPSGRLANEGTLAALSEVAADRGAFLLVDEVYAPFAVETPDADRTAFGGVTAAGLPNAAITNSLTKFHGLYDVSLGWIAGDPTFVGRASRVERHTNAVAKPSVEFGKQALHRTPEFVEESRDLLAERFDRLSTFVAGRDDLAGEAIPENIIAFLGHEGADGDAVTAAAREAGVAVQPGRFFGAPERFRVALGRDLEQVEAGLDRLGTVLDGL